MKAIPRARAVRQALRTTEIAVRDALKELNKTAGDLMAKGDYTGAEALAAKGRQIQEFQGRIRELRREWKELRTGKADNGEVRGKIHTAVGLLPVNLEGTRRGRGGGTPHGTGTRRPETPSGHRTAWR